MSVHLPPFVFSDLKSDKPDRKLRLINGDFFFLTYGLKVFSVIDINGIEVDIYRLFNKLDISLKSRGIQWQALS